VAEYCLDFQYVWWNLKKPFLFFEEAEESILGILEVKRITFK
jgi:hypothetical protein